MLYPDLVARTCGFVGVLGALITLGVWDNPEFLITPQPSYAPVELQITSLNNRANTAIPHDIARTQEPVKAHETKANEATAKSQADTANALALDHTPTQTPAPAAIEKTAPAPQPSQTLSASQKATTPATTHTAITAKTDTANTAITAKQAQTKPTPNNSARTTSNTTKKANTAKTNTAITTKQTKTNQKTQTKPTPDTSARAAKSSTKTAITAKNADATLTANTANANTANTANTAVAQQRLQSQVANLLVQEIKRKLRYPRNAVRRKLEGVVQVEFKVAQGKITGFRLSKSSGHKILDDAASKLATGMVNMSIPVNASSTIVVVPIKYELL